jgi:hypothetical protein
VHLDLLLHYILTVFAVLHLPDLLSNNQCGALSLSELSHCVV